MTLDAHADLVLTGGRIATMDAARRWATALAVRDGRIVAVGSDTAVRLAIGARTRVIELRGRTVTPGFQDAHVHPVGAGLADAPRESGRSSPRRGVRADHRGVRVDAPGRAMDPRRWVVHGRVRARDASS